MRTRWIATMVLAAAGVARAEVLPFNDAELVGLESGGIDAAVSGDFDGDGDEDLVYASRNSSRVSWSRNERGVFSARATLFPREGVRRLVAADFDLDGRIDLVTATASGVLAWHRGRAPVAGLAQFDTRGAFATTLSGVTVLAAGDINGDGRPDLIAGRDESAPLHAFLFTASATGFGADITVAVPAGAGRIAGLGIADFDRNGFADVVGTASTAGGSPLAGTQLFVVPRTSATTFGTAVIVQQTENLAGLPVTTFGELVVTELNSSGLFDVVFVANRSSGSNELVLRPNIGNGLGSLLQSSTVVDSSPTPYAALRAADFDRDGDTDLAFNGVPGQTGAWLDNTRAQPLFTRRSVGPGVAAPDAVATFVFDEDLDGDPDFLDALASGDLRRARNRRIHGRVFGDALQSGTLLTQAPSGALSGPFEVVTRRRGRGSPREAVFTEFTGGRVGTLTLARATFTSTPTIAPAITIGNVGAAREISVIDVDYDGDEDFVLATGQSGSALASNQNRITLSLNAAPSPPVNQIQTCAGGLDIRGVAVGEILNPGMGVVYASEDNDRVASFVLCPGETEISTVANGKPNGPGVSKLGDLDGDGDLDLLVAARFDDEGALAGDLLGWYPNAGNGSFGALQRIAVVDGAREATLLDFNRDGRLDIATAAGTSVLLFPGNGDGTFGSPLIAATGIVAPGRVAAADADHDGDIDLFVPSESTAAKPPTRTQCGVSFLVNRGNDTFDPPICADQRHPLPYSRLAVDDLDRDGVADVIATSFNENAIATFSPERPEQFISDQILLQSTASVGDNEEHCGFANVLEHGGRPGDSDLALVSYRLDAETPDTAGLIAGVVLRRDDGDDVPEVTDPEVGRTTVQDATPQNRYTIAMSATRQSALDFREKYWACVQASAHVPASAAITLFSPGNTVQDASTAGFVRGVSFLLFSSERMQLRSARIFEDGLE